MTALLLWLPLSLVVGIAVGRCIRVGTVDTKPQQRKASEMVDVAAIKRQIVEHREIDVAGNRVLYRWDFGPYSAHLEFYPEFGDEIEWALTARVAAANLISKMAKETPP
jgi:hypothetical protein